MQEISKGPRYLMRWDHSRRQMIQRDVSTTLHRLGELSLFSDDAIADAIDRYPRTAISLSTMGDNPAHATRWQAGRLGKQDGWELLQMIRHGRLQMILWDLHQHQLAISPIIERLFREVKECQPGLRPFGIEGQLLISSPSASQYYNCETIPGILWHLRGRQRVWVYPAGNPHLSPRTIEDIVSGQRVDTIYYEPDFDDQAQTIDLEADQMLALPQYTPHRIANLDGLNITLKTRFRTRDVLRRNDIHRANRMLRRFLPLQFHSHRASGPMATMKQLLVNLVDLKGHRESHDDRHAGRCPGQETFTVDAKTNDCLSPQLRPAASQGQVSSTASAAEVSSAVTTSPGKSPIIPLTIEIPVADAAAQEH